MRRDEANFLGNLRNAADYPNPKAIASNSNPIITVAALTLLIILLTTPKPKTAKCQHQSIELAEVAPEALTSLAITH